MKADRSGCLPCFVRRGGDKNIQQSGELLTAIKKKACEVDITKNNEKYLNYESGDEYSGEDSYEEIEFKVQRSKNGPQISLCIQIDKQTQKLIEAGKINLEMPPTTFEDEDSSDESASYSRSSESSESIQAYADSQLTLVIVKDKAPQRLLDYKYSGGSDLQVIPNETPATKQLFSECSICYSSIYKKSSNSCYMDCLHWFHFTCLRKWAEKSKECPVCRASFSRIMKPA